MCNTHSEHLEDSGPTQQRRDHETHFLHSHIVSVARARLLANLWWWAIELMTFFMCCFDMKSKRVKVWRIKPQRREVVLSMSLTVSGIHKEGYYWDCSRWLRCSSHKHSGADRAHLSWHKSPWVFRKDQISYKFDMLNSW